MAKKVEPRHFYLNEQHELSRGEREGGGSLPKFGPIDWGSKQRRLGSSLAAAQRAIHKSEDPLKDRRYFLLASPEPGVPKETINKRKAESGHYLEPVDFSGKDGRVLARLGLDVIGVSGAGAVVHATPEKYEQLTSLAHRLEGLGRAEQARWASVAEFGLIPESVRADREWLDSIKATGREEAVIELQPMLSRLEVSLVLRTIAERLRSGEGEGILGSGTDYSGRGWFRAALGRRTILEIVRKFFSVQSVHPPLLSGVAAAKSNSAPLSPTQLSVAEDQFPVVAVVDTGVAKNHSQLERFRRGTFIHPLSAGVFDEHGTFVTSRIVFGDSPDPITSVPRGTFRFVDVVVAKDQNSIEDKAVVGAIESTAVNFPDARAFNLSFGDRRALALHTEVDRSERLFLTQDLDNLIFARDILVVVAAGNVPAGLLPNPAYPEHWNDPAWGLGAWAVGFNTLKCGSFVREWTMSGGLADVPFAPSPFCRVGPALAGAPAPDFGAHGGNCTAAYGIAPALGVYGLTRRGHWEDRIGTSHAAPLLTRECAAALLILQRLCPPGTQPFACTVKALMALTAEPHQLPSRYAAAAEKAIGHGEASIRRLKEPSSTDALFVWQGILANKGDVARILLPIPLAWLMAAGDPAVEVVASWDTPVNAALPNLYGCRQVDVLLKSSPDAEAVRSSRGRNRAYPLRKRVHSLKKVLDKDQAPEDLWVLEASYQEVCDYPPTLAFTPEQRVSIALRVFDRAGIASPQEAIQKQEIASTMNRLSATPIPSGLAVTVRSAT